MSKKQFKYKQKPTPEKDKKPNSIYPMLYSFETNLQLIQLRNIPIKNKNKFLQYLKYNLLLCFVNIY